MKNTARFKFPQEKPKRRQRRKRGPFFKFPLMEYQDSGYRAMAKCLGLTHRQLFDFCLQAWLREVEPALGFGAATASDLTPQQIKAIAARMKLVHHASWRGGNEHRN